MVKSYPENHDRLLIAIFIAWGISVAILAMAPLLNKLLKEKGLAALERLMGTLVSTISQSIFCPIATHAMSSKWFDELGLVNFEEIRKKYVFSVHAG